MYIINSTKHDILLALKQLYNHKQMKTNYIIYINPLYTANPLKGTLTNSEDPDEMQHDAAYFRSALFAKIKKPS